MSKVIYSELPVSSSSFYKLVALVSVFMLAGLSAAYYMEHHGHFVTGMSNQVVWGLPHVFAIFLIVAASGALNIASIGTVFNKNDYKPLGRLSTWLALALLIGGLIILVLDLGRPDRLIIAMLYYNFSSVFAWNIYFYVGFIAIVTIYLWFQMETKMNTYAKAMGAFAFAWRLALTTATGTIFGVLIARESYNLFVMPPLFISMSLALGLAIFNISLLLANRAGNLALRSETTLKLTRLLGVFVAVVLFFAVVLALTNIFVTGNEHVQQFILFNGGIYSGLFWVGQIMLGFVLPLILAFTRAVISHRRLAVVSTLVCIGSFTQLYLLVIAGQVWPLDLFPGSTVSSSFFDGVIASYIPSLPELILGLGGVAISALIVIVGVKVLKLLPRRFTLPQA